MSTLSKCLRLVPSDLRWYWLLTAPISLITAGLETATAAAIYLLVKAATDPGSLVSMPMVSRLVTRIPVQSDSAMVFALATLFVVFYLGKTAFIVAAGYAREVALGKATIRLSSMFFRLYMTAPYAFHRRRNSSDLIQQVNYNVERALGGAMASYAALFLETLTVLGLVGAMLVAAPVVTLTVGSVVCVFLWLFLRRTKAEMIRFGEESHRLNTGMLEQVRQGLGAIKEIAVLGREDHFLHSHDSLKEEALRARVRRRALLAVPRLGTEAIAAIGGLSVLAAFTLTSEGGLHAAPLLAVYSYGVFRLLPASNRIPALVAELRWCAPHVDRLYEDYTTLQAASGSERASVSPAVFSNVINVEDVHFAYDSGPKRALKGVSLHVARGESVGIVGPTGAGKTTLMDLMIGLNEPTSGRVTVDGRDLREMGRAWRQQIGYVPQMIYLVDDSIRRNIGLGLSDDQIDEKRVSRAVQMANLEAVVRELPDGLDTRVGERGVRLSGGQRQRIGIARALYHDPALLVFDEATSSLDSVTEAEVIRAVEDLQGEKTLIVIAHRLSTVRSCQRLVFLREGEVHAVGTWDELLRESSEFRGMVRLADLPLPEAAASRGIEHVVE